MIPPIVSVDWWRAHRDDVVTADVRYYLDGRSARAAYDRGHLAGAVFVDMDRWLSSPGRPEDGRHPLPTPAVFAEGMATVGIGDGDTVVAYDDAGGTTAARLVWMLRALGRDAALLDGGLAGVDEPLTTVVPAARQVTVTEVPWPADRLATAEEALDPAHLVLDARDPVRFRGEAEPVDPIAGHIPGARNLPCRAHLDPDGRFLAATELRRRFESVGVGDGREVVSYCGSGVNACHNLLAMEHAGLGLGRLYPGSWSSWSNTPGRPVATGD